MDEDRNILRTQIDRGFHDFVQPPPIRIEGNLHPGDLVVPMIGVGQQEGEAHLQTRDHENGQQQNEQDGRDRPPPSQPTLIRDEGDADGGE